MVLHFRMSLNGYCAVIGAANMIKALFKGMFTSIGVILGCWLVYCFLMYWSIYVIG